VAADELGGRVDGDVRAPLNRARERGRGRRVVYDERQAVAMRDLGQALYVEHVEFRVADRLGVDGFRPVVDGLLEAVVVGRVHEADGDAELRQRVVEEVVGAAVERGGRDDLVAAAGERQNCERLGGLARGEREPGRAAFERGDPLLEDICRRVHDARVDVAELLQGEEARGVVSVVEDVGRGLVDGHGPRMGGRVRLLPAVDGERRQV
jgi:hypothetical protein